MSLSAKTHTTGDGISKTTTDTTTDRTASAHHGTGADITVRSTVLITAHTTTITGTVGDIITLGAATATTVITILGTTEDTMADSTILGTMTHGITEDTGEDTTAITDIWDGMTHGTTTITDGIILTTVRRTLWEVLTSNLVITDSVRIQREDRSHQAIRQGLQ